MSYNLIDFSKQYDNERKEKNKADNEKFQSFSDEEVLKAKEQAETLINKYQNMSNDELTQMLINEIAKQKANGTFNKEKLLVMLESVKELLPNQNQYKTLQNFIVNL